MRKSSPMPNLRIHPSFPPMGNALPAYQGSQYTPPVNQYSYQLALNRQPPKDMYGPEDTPQS